MDNRKDRMPLNSPSQGRGKKAFKHRTIKVLPSFEDEIKRVSKPDYF